MAILFADSFNSYVSGTVLTGGSVNAFDGLLRAGYEQPFLLAGVTGHSAGVLTNGGKQNNGAAARICWQNNSGNSALIYDPPLDAIGLKRIFSFHWERFICLSSQIRLTRVWAAPQVGTKIPVIVFGPVTVYASQTTVNGVAVYKLYANNSAQIGQIDSGSWPSIDIEINREQKKLRVWLANIKIWEADSDYFTTTSFEYVGMARKPNPDNVAVHVGTIDVDSVVIFDGSGTTNNERTISLAAKTFAADQVVESSFGYVGNANSLTNISSAFLLNDSLDLRYQNTVLPNARDLFKLSSTADSPPMGVSVTTVFKSIEADSQPVKFAYKFNEDAIAYKTPFLQAGGWRQRKVVFNSAPDGTEWAPDKVPQLAWGYEVSDTKEYTSLVNGAFEYLVFGTNDLFDMYRGDPDPTYVNPVKPEYVIPNLVIEDSGPGSKTLSAGGTAQLGYFGTVESKLVFPFQTLPTLFPLTEGTETNATPDWLKFANGGKILFVAKKPMRTDISWQTLYQAGLVYGVDGPGLTSLPVGSPVNQLRIVKSGGFKYRLRLLQGADADPSDARNDTADPLGFRNSEYSRLLLRCSDTDPTATFWERFTDLELGRLENSIVNITWCFEKHPTSATNRVARGYPSISGIKASDGTVAVNDSPSLKNCWRPVLEYIGIDEDYVPPPENGVLVWDSNGKGITGGVPSYVGPYKKVASTNRMYLTTTPLKYLTPELEIVTLPAVSFADSSAIFTALSDSVIIAGRSYNGDYKISGNGGQSWTTYSPPNGASGTGEAYMFKGAVYVKHNVASPNTTMRKFANPANMAAFTEFSVPFPNFLASNGYDVNENVIVAVTGNSTYVDIYVSWDGSTFTAYPIGNDSSGAMILYVGFNVFMVRMQGSLAIPKFMYVPTTKGAPTNIGTLPSSVLGVMQFDNKLVALKTTEMFVLPKPKRVDSFNATLAEARAHFAEIEKTLLQPSKTVMNVSWFVPWYAQNKLLLGTRTDSQLWDVS